MFLHASGTLLLLVGSIASTVAANDAPPDATVSTSRPDAASSSPTAKLIALLSVRREPLYWVSHDITQLWRDVEQLLADGADAGVAYRYGANVWRSVFVAYSHCEQVGIPPDLPPAHKERSAEYGRKRHEVLMRECRERLRLAQRHYVAFLIEHRVDVKLGARLSTEGSPVNTALRSSMWQRNCDIMQLLLNSGADANESYENGDTPLSYAVGIGDSCILCALLNAGAKVDIRNGDGEMPLHRAARFGSAETVRALLDYGAPILAADSEGRTAMQLATSLHRRQARRVLLRAQGAGGESVSKTFCLGQENRRD